MATVASIVTRAYRKLHVVSEDEELQADTLANGVEAYNGMLAEWKLRDVDIEHTAQTSTDTFPLGIEYEDGTVYLLAQRLSPDYMMPAAFDADDFFRTMQAAYMEIEKVTFEGAVSRPPSYYSKSPHAQKWRF